MPPEEKSKITVNPIDMYYLGVMVSMCNAELFLIPFCLYKIMVAH